MSHVLDSISLSKKFANKLGVSVEFLEAAKKDLVPLSLGLSSKVNYYFNIPVPRLMEKYISLMHSDIIKPGLNEEFEFLSNQKSIKTFLKSLILENKPINDADQLLAAIQNANGSLYFSDPLSKIALNVTNELSGISMGAYGLGDTNSFPVLKPLPRGGETSLDSFMLVSDETSGFETYEARSEFLPVYVKSVTTDSGRFKPLFDKNGLRINTLFEINSVSIELQNTKGRLVNRLSTLIKNFHSDKSFSPSFSGFIFDGYNIKGPAMFTDRVDPFGNPHYAYRNDTKLLSIDDDTITVFYYPVTMFSSGTNDRENYSRPTASALWLLDKIPGIYYGKK